MGEQTIQKVRRHEKDTGTPEAQIASLTDRIRALTDHLRGNRKDFAAHRSLLKLVGRRARLLDYLKRRDSETHTKVVEALGLRSR